MHRRRIVGTALVAFSLLAAACGSDDAQTTNDTAAPGGGGDDGGQLVMGLLVPESGDLSVIVDSLAKPTRLAIDQINAAGGVNGRPVRLEQADDGSDAQTTSTSFDNLVNSRNIDVLVGPAASTSAKAILDKIKSQGITACSGSTTAAELTKLDSGGFFFRTAPTDDLQGPALAEVVTNDGKSQVGILARNDEYGTGFASSVESALQDTGASVVANVVYDPNGSNFDGDVTRVLDANPDAVVVLGFADDGAKIVNTLIGKGAGPDQMALYTADGIKGSTFHEKVDPTNPAKVQGMKGTAPAAAPEGVESPFQAEFPSLNVDPIFASYYWDCTNLLALAAVKAKSNDSAQIKEAFAANVQGEVDCNDFASCKDLLDQGQTIHYRGASNRFEKWAENGQEPATGAYDVWQFDAEGKDGNLDVPQIKV
jgi:branched-chain amino acid transport system substrate-binding protein